MLPVCNNRASVLALLDGLKAEPEPASRLRLVRLHGREGVPRPDLEALPEWARSQELLTRYATTPALKLEGDRMGPKAGPTKT
jgi:hypothetical protein